MQCVGCGADNPEEAKFCLECGQGLTPESSPADPSPLAAQEVPAADPEPPESSPAQEVVTAVDSAPAPVAEPMQPMMAAHPRFAPPSLDQAVALVESEKRYPKISVPVGIGSFVILLIALGLLDDRGSYFLPVSILGAAVIYLGTHFLLLPAVWPPTILCPHCGKQVPTAKNALPRGVWPWACPHCRQELVPLAAKG